MGENKFYWFFVTLKIVRKDQYIIMNVCMWENLNINLNFLFGKRVVVCHEMKKKMGNQ